jgi:alkylation response protein AidB-like acyl-CoA dehydrogenase
MRVHLERLKDKLGNRSNASSEVEFLSLRLAGGEEGDGVRQILKMGGLTRLTARWAATPDASGLFGGAVSCAAASGIR